MHFELVKETMQITGYTSSDKTPKTLKYDASYEDISLP